MTDFSRDTKSFGWGINLDLCSVKLECSSLTSCICVGVTVQV